MLRTNLATRPFYNTRAVRVALCAVGAVVLVATFFNGARLVEVGLSERSRGARMTVTENEAARLRTETQQMLGRTDPERMEDVTGAAREANAIIDRRAFSWTALFERLEATLPADVRVTAVRPRLEEVGRVVLAIGVKARRVEDLDVFVESLEMDAGFYGVLAIETQTDAAGLVEALIEGVYSQSAEGSGMTLPASMDSASGG